jgi:hypothetical protein
MRRRIIGQILRQIEGDNIGAAPLHLETDKAIGRADLQHALAAKIQIAKILRDARAQIPLPRLHAMTRYVDRMVKGTVRQSRQLRRRRAIRWLHCHKITRNHRYRNVCRTHAALARGGAVRSAARPPPTEPAAKF